MLLRSVQRVIGTSSRLAKEGVKPIAFYTTLPQSSATAAFEEHVSKARLVESRDPRYNSIELELGDSESLRIPLVWLRDHCRSPGYYNWDTNQRRSNMTQLFSRAVLDEKGLDFDKRNQTISIHWQDGHQSVFHAKELLDWAVFTRKDYDECGARTLWGAATLKEIPSVSSQHLDFTTFARLFVRFGVVALTGVDARNEKATKKLCERIAPPHDTFYGSFWLVGETDDSNQSGYEDELFTSDEVLGPHTDGTYLDSPPGIQVLHCLRQADQGGETWLVDGFAVAEQLRKERPDLFEVLATTPVEHQFVEGLTLKPPDDELAYFNDDDDTPIPVKEEKTPIHARSVSKCVIETFKHKISQIRFNPYDRAPLRTLRVVELDASAAERNVELTVAWYEAYERLSQLIHDERNSVRVKLQPGTAIFMDNTRVLHARTAFKSCMAYTQVYHYLDDERTPYVTRVPVPPDALTLGDFKKVLNKKNYSYYQKVYDPNVGFVKQHLQDNNELLRPNNEGRIELLLTCNGPSSSSQNGAKLPFKNGLPAHLMPYAAGSSICDLDVCGGQRVSMVTAEPSISGAGSYMSKRAGEHLASLDNTSASEDPYCYEPASANDQSSSDYLRVMNNPRRRQRRERYRRPYVPSTISSQSGMSSVPQVTEISLDLREHPLGIQVAIYDGAFMISKILPNSAADLCAALAVGDQIVQVENTSFEDLAEDQVLSLLRKVSNQKRIVRLLVARYRRLSDQRSDALSALCETAEIDVSLWVEGTRQMDNNPFDEEPVARAPTLASGVPPDYADDTSDEEKAAYDDRRNGKGAKLVPQVQAIRSFQQQQRLGMLPPALVTANVLGAPQDAANPIPIGVPSAAPTAMPIPIAPNGNAARVPVGLSSEVMNDENDKQIRLSTADPIEYVVRQMARPDSGLKVKDRKWLKIPILMSFIGHELVNWLVENVAGFENRKQARSYAKQLLEKGLIKHAVNMNTFSEKCYYKFQDQVCEERMHLEQQAKMTAAESPTEITYMSGPSSPHQQHRQVVANGFHANGLDAHVLQQLPMNFVPQAQRAPALPPKSSHAQAQQATLTTSTLPNPALPLNSTSAPNRTMNNVTADLTKWQLSPISHVGPSPRYPRDCESPTVSGIYDVVKH